MYWFQDRRVLRTRQSGLSDLSRDTQMGSVWGQIGTLDLPSLGLVLNKSSSIFKSPQEIITIPCPFLSRSQVKAQKDDLPSHCKFSTPCHWFSSQSRSNALAWVTSDTELIDVKPLFLILCNWTFFLKFKNLTFLLGINTVYWFQSRRMVRVGNGVQMTCPGSHSWEVSEARFELGPPISRLGSQSTELPSCSSCEEFCKL